MNSNVNNTVGKAIGGSASGLTCRVGEVSYRNVQEILVIYIYIYYRRERDDMLGSHL